MSAGKGVVMAWSNSDAQLYNALLWEQHLGSGNPTKLQDLYGLTFLCATSTMQIIKPERETYYWKMPRHWWADPLNGWFIAQLILWIPVNIIYVSYQLVRDLVSARNSWGYPSTSTARLDAAQLSVAAQLGAPAWSIPYQQITSLGLYSNGLRIRSAVGQYLVNSEAVPTIFVALTYLAPQAQIVTGLLIPDGFAQKCASEGHPVNVGQMSRNGPDTWRYPGKETRLGLPVRAIIGLAISAFVIIIFILSNVLH